MDNSQTFGQHNFRIGVFDVQPARNLVSNNDETQSLEPRIMDVLCVLASEPGEVHTRDSLIERVWKVKYGADESLTRAVGVLRKTFRDAGEDVEYIETITKRGYRLIQPVTVLEAASRTAVPAFGFSDNRRRKRFSAGLAAVSVMVAAVVGYSMLTPNLNQAPAESNDFVGEAEIEQISIAVLPFDDFSESKDQEYFADGIAEELLNVLAQVDGLRVTSRTSAFTFRNNDANVVEIADILNVGHILLGSIRKSETSLRISIQLIDASSDEQIWSQTYDCPLSTENLFETQNDIAKAIVGELKGQLSINASLSRLRPASLEAYELYLRSRYQINKRLPSHLDAGIAGFKLVIEIDPEFAPAYSGLADAYKLMKNHAGADHAEMNDLMEPLFVRALELAPNSAEVLTSLAWREQNGEKALLYAERAVEANPNYVPAYHRYGRTLRRHGQHEKALAVLQLGLTIDPLSSIMMSEIFFLQNNTGDRDAALQTAKNNIKLNPDLPFGYNDLAIVQIEQGNYPGAHIILKDAQALNPHDHHTVRLLSLIYTQVGLFNHALTVAKRPEHQGFALVASGDTRAARKILDAKENTTGVVYYRLGEFSKAYPDLRKLATRVNMTHRLIDRRDAKVIAALADVYQRERDAEADLMITRLAGYIEGKDPSEFHLPHLSTASGDVEFLKGNFKAGIKMYAKAADLGLAEAGAEFMRFPGIDEIRDKPAWKRVEKRLQGNAAKARAEIEAQLANPKPNWIMNTTIAE